MLLDENNSRQWGQATRVCQLPVLTFPTFEQLRQLTCFLLEESSEPQRTKTKNCKLCTILLARVTTGCEKNLEEYLQGTSRADFYSTMHVLSTTRGCTLVENETYRCHGALRGKKT